MNKTKGMVHIYTGDGKGKTSAALGLAMRAVGAGLKVYMGQFIKKGVCSEMHAALRLAPSLVVEQFGRERSIGSPMTDEDKECALKGFESVSIIISEGRYDVVILDELNIAIHYHLIDEDRVLELFDKKPHELELVVTGRYAKETIKKRADLVTEMMCVKHYFENGVAARLGIEK